MFSKVFFHLLCQSLNDIQPQFREILISKLMNQEYFRKFLNTNINQSDKKMAENMLQFYQENQLEGIKSALVWKSFASTNENESIILKYQTHSGQLDTYVLHFFKYNVKSQQIQRELYSIEGQGKHIFFSMEKRNQPINKIYNTVKKYSLRLL